MKTNRFDVYLYLLNKYKLSIIIAILGLIILTLLEFSTISLFYPLINLTLDGSYDINNKLPNIINSIIKYFSLNINTLFMIKLVMILNLLTLFAGLIYEYFIVSLRYNYFSFYMSDVFEKLLHEKLSFFIKTSYGDIFNIGHTFSQAASEILLYFPKIAFGFLKVSILLSYLIIINRANIFFTILIFVGFGYLVFLIGKRISSNHSIKLEKYRSNFLSIFEEAINGIRQIKIFSMEGIWKEKYKNEVHSFSKESKIIVYSSSFISYLGNFMIIFISLILLLSLDTETENKSQIATLSMTIFLLLQSFPPALQLGNNWIGMKSCNARVVSLYEFIKNNPIQENNDRKEFIEEINSIQFKNVNFGYTDNQNVVKNISFLIKKNQRLVLLGESGSGKSTILDLLMNLLGNYTGQILVNGLDINSVDRESYTRKISYVSQEPLLFRDTIKENIKIGNSEAKEPDFKRVLELSESKRFIQDLPEGLNTMLGTRGSGLSGGQKQRISIARALIKKPDVLILDEATSALDNKLSEKVEKNLYGLLTSTIQVVVTHNEGIINENDIVIRLNKV